MASVPKKTAPKKAPEPRASAQKYIRNLREIPVGIRLDRHSDKARFDLKPRGQRGDTISVQKDDLIDPIFQHNYSLGVFEVLTSVEAASVLAKQVVNQQTASHPALAMLVNERGEKYEQDAIHTERPHEEQGVVVGKVDEKGNTLRRGPEIMEPGIPAGVQGAAPNHAPANEDPAFLSDLNARRKDLEGPQAGLGGITNVTVAPVQKG